VKSIITYYDDFHQGVNMRDFYFDGEENENENEFDEMINEAMESLVSVDYVYMQGTRNSELLEYSIRLCEKSIFWCFRSEDYKLNKVVDTFFILKDLFSEEENEK